MQKKKKFDANKIIFIILLMFFALSLALSILSAIFEILGIAQKFANQSLSTYIVRIFQSIQGIVLLFVPIILTKKYKLQIPIFITIAYSFFLFGSIYMGDLLNLYYKMPFWDKIMHFFSGAIWCLVGFSIITLLIKQKYIKLNGFLVLFFTFCFVMTMGLLWEIVEFIIDTLVKGSNMQRFMLEDGTKLVGQKALADTMGDIIANGLGALFVSIIGIISMRKGNDFLEKVIIKKTKSIALYTTEINLSETSNIENEVSENNLKTNEENSLNEKEND